MDFNSVQQNSYILQKQIFDKLKDKITDFNYQHKYNDDNIIWNDGSTKLINLNAKSEKSVLIIPSLINKSYIFDLQENNSFIKFLQNGDINVYLIDWGEPDLSELHYDIADYCKRIDKIIEFICKTNNTNISLLGHCLGGLIAIATALKNNNYINSLSLISTPWDFHQEKFARFNFDECEINNINSTLDQTDLVPAYAIHAIFCYLHIESVINKLDKFNYLMEKDNTQGEIDNFLSIENWLNDGISMPSNLARTCFIDFAHNNHPEHIKWQIDGNIIDPKHLQVPILFINSKKDRIVPYESTENLMQIIGKYDEINTNTGHVAMVAGLKAKEKTWQPYLDWLYNIWN